MTPLSRARLVAIITPALLLAGALGSQFIGHLVPCEMCLWQRWPHLVAIGLALVAIAIRSAPAASRGLTALAAIAILVSGGLGVLHAGVEYGWWEGFTGCAAPANLSGSPDDILKQIMAAPIVRCDQAQWSLFGISLAGWNAIFSLTAGAVILWLIAKPAR